MTLSRGRGSKIGRAFATFDHVIPHSEGGTAYYKNLKLAHRACNNARNSRPVAEARARKLMNEISQHFPAYFERFGEPVPRAGFTTLAELEAVPFVARWKAENPNFLRFSKSDNYLMAEIGPTLGKPAGSYWVVGLLRDPAAVDLPEWVETEPQRLSREAWNREGGW